MKNLLENNKLIADFMDLGVQLHLVEHPITGEYVDAKYHVSYDWLMPVVEKISSLTSKNTFNNINSNVAFYKILSLNIDTSLEHIYKSVVEFIKWYNENNKK